MTSAMTGATTAALLAGQRGYVGLMRLVRAGLKPLGIGDRPACPREHRYRHWLQSLLAIHDIDALIQLDVPWWTYGAIGEVEDFLRSHSDARVFEWGSGASTVWLAKRAGEVISVDHDAEWIDFSRPRLAALGNATVELVPPDPATDPDPHYLSAKPGYVGRTFRAYVDAIDRWPGRFDLIVVDGRARSACLAKAGGRLAPGGMIVFDNSHRPRYRAAIRACGLEERALRGLVPSLPHPDQTTLLTARTTAGA